MPLYDGDKDFAAGVLPVNADKGFLRAPKIELGESATPTGTPMQFGNGVPIVVDTTGKLWVWVAGDEGGWRTHAGSDGRDGLDGVTFTARGPWATGSEYVEGDVVERLGNGYACIADHTASSSNAPTGDAATNNQWNIIVRKGDNGLNGPIVFRGEFFSTSTYRARDLVRESAHGRVYYCRSRVPAGTLTEIPYSGNAQFAVFMVDGATSAELLELVRQAREARDNARDSATNAGRSETNAGDSAGAAARSANTATDKASEAVDAAGNASGYAMNAVDARDDAQAAQGLAEGARDDAVDAKDLAIQAQTASESARDLSVSAKDLSIEAKDDAVDAKDLAEDAQTAATSAKDLAVDAQTAAESARDLAVGAKTASENARDLSVSAKDLAVDAKNKAVSAKDLAVEAKDDAEDAETAAVGAKDLAVDAKTASESARDLAIQAKDNAEDAEDDAVDAKTAAEAAETRINNLLINKLDTPTNQATTCSGFYLQSNVSGTGQNRVVSSTWVQAGPNTPAADSEIFFKTTCSTVTEYNNHDVQIHFIKTNSESKIEVSTRAKGTTGTGGWTRAATAYVNDITVG